MSEQDGGPAFPRSIVHVLTDGQVMGYEAEGMSLRDYFAAAALQGLVANQHMGPADIGEFFDEDARRCYQMADAMLRARKEPQT